MGNEATIVRSLKVGGVPCNITACTPLIRTLPLCSLDGTFSKEKDCPSHHFWCEMITSVNPSRYAVMASLCQPSSVGTLPSDLGGGERMIIIVESRLQTGVDFPFPPAPPPPTPAPRTFLLGVLAHPVRIRPCTTPAPCCRDCRRVPRCTPWHHGGGRRALHGHRAQRAPYPPRLAHRPLRGV